MFRVIHLPGEIKEHVCSTQQEVEDYIREHLCKHCKADLEMGVDRFHDTINNVSDTACAAEFLTEEI